MCRAPVLTALVAYETAVVLQLRRWSKQKRASPWAFRYLNVAVEVSAPALLMIPMAATLGLGQSLFSAAPFFTFVLIGFSALYLDFRLCAFAGLVAAAEFLVLSMMAASRTTPVEGWELLTSSAAYRMKSALLLVAGLASGFVAVQCRRQMMAATRSVAERDRAVSMFGQHVSPQVADLLLRQPVEFAGEERSVGVMFLDIRDFSHIAGDRSPAEVVDYLNTLFGELIQVVNRHQGFVNKFLGDGFMAVFGAPVDDSGQARHGVEAALEMLGVVERLNAQGRIPTTRIGIGLHMGEAVTGNVGSSDRKEYTIIGDVVNLASRIEQATKQFHARLLVSEAVRRELDPTSFPSEDLGEVVLKGQRRPARLYKLA